MTFLRPEAKDAVWHWREVIAGFILFLLGLWLVTRPGFLLAFPGYAALAVGGLLVWLGVQRGRFRRADDGAGAVQVDEGQVTYFGPLSGGTIALREMESLTLDGKMFPAHWRLAQQGQPALLIPVNAVGAEALFDAFAALPGLRTERMLTNLRSAPHQAVVIWQRDPLRPVGTLLH
ncbi:hypothetical protein OS190_04310 [Sulfitobacter sp. F26204]|uniref:hypothetical protein n=1 Tax=Sulfitobacter sp. F26204 TaxID=2996014 RepID=UPI00225E3498|nr:hypothetical protein [Sulfitobacter sp. F26204]MCX7558778.1 hypothetical protein [Sulfitobacter sp. F26204]